ncbi:probable transcriptional regulator RABBIT EARS [Punica granatum]|uniref:C2H2-type domain-containing protein n=2 Tax=Punica granatum TaxID=22663 RepID=A0A218XR64_PUNGR|nr:probable transcriptional regulator RABBIT EARS [Punica granatum]OWM87467.1 hypothetical protein CDL15_Pgr022578 [Punica granatum]PKI46603.1 hypothetical protein CRG98_032945 [Punica granatum]
MELAHQYLMSMKRRGLLRPPQLCGNFSWEEKAFADDTSGVLGGIVWPPRSYSCSFCNREFRSAQALGGHMNVHRRDRARLKQSLITTTTTSSAATPGEVQILQHQSRPNFSSPLQLPIRTRVSPVSSSKENNGDGSCIPCPNDPLMARKGSFDLLLRKEEPTCFDHGSDDTTLSVGLNDTVMGPRAFGHNGEMSFKKPKTSTSSPLALYLRPCSSDRSCSLQSSTGLKVGSVEDLDLELRLGDPRKVK